VKIGAVRHCDGGVGSIDATRERSRGRLDSGARPLSQETCRVFGTAVPLSAEGVTRCRKSASDRARSRFPAPAASLFSVAQAAARRAIESAGDPSAFSVIDAHYDERYCVDRYQPGARRARAALGGLGAAARRRSSSKTDGADPRRQRATQQRSAAPSIFRRPLRQVGTSVLRGAALPSAQSRGRSHLVTALRRKRRARRRCIALAGAERWAEASRCGGATPERLATRARQRPRLPLRARAGFATAAAGPHHGGTRRTPA
jgi:hypothetical protein